MGEAENSDSVQRFIAAADSFCRVLERKHRSKRAFAKQALRLTGNLYLCGLDLPDTDPDPDYNPLGEWWERNKHVSIEEQVRQDPRIQAHSERYQRVHKTISASLGGDQPYLMIFEPLSRRSPYGGHCVG